MQLLVSSVIIDPLLVTLLLPSSLQCLVQNRNLCSSYVFKTKLIYKIEHTLNSVFILNSDFPKRFSTN